MAKDLLGGLGGLMKGLSSLMPQDDPNVKLLNAQTELSDLHRQEEEIYAEIGRKAVEVYGGSSFGDQFTRLHILQSNIVQAEGKLRVLQQDKESAEKAAREEKEKRICPECGVENPDGVKFCQERGTRLGGGPRKNICPECGTENPSGARFCGECGRRMSEV